MSAELLMTEHEVDVRARFDEGGRLIFAISAGPLFSSSNTALMFDTLQRLACLFWFLGVNDPDTPGRWMAWESYEAT